MKWRYYLLFAFAAGFLMKVFIKPTVKAEGPPPARTCGLAHRDVFATLIGGAVLGHVVERKPHHGILAMFLFAPFIHVLFGIKTGLNHQLGWSDKPDGTGPLALPVD